MSPLAAPAAPLLGDADVATVAALIADDARAAMLFALSDGRALPAGELARVGGVAPATASAHLARLVAGGLLTVERAGRHRYYRMANSVLVEALEALAAIAQPRGTASAREAHAARQIRLARTCYDHLAGTVGVRVTEALVEQRSLTLSGRTFALTRAGEERLAAIGVAVAEARAARRVFARACLDWSERRYHLAGALGAVLCSRLLDLEWVARLPCTRALRVTDAGRRALRRHFGVIVF